MTATEAKTLIYTLMGEDSASLIHVTSEQVEAWIRVSLNDIAERTRFILKNYRAQLPAENTLALGYDLISIRRFETEDDGRMYPITTRVLERANRDWRSLTGRPVHYYMDNQQANPGAVVLALYPLQSSATWYRIYYEAYPEDFIDGVTADEDDDMEIPTWVAHAVVYGALSLAYSSDRRRMNLRASRFYRGMYDRLVERLRVRANKRIPKTWVHGQTSARKISVREKLPRNITE